MTHTIPESNSTATGQNLDQAFAARLQIADVSLHLLSCLALILFSIVIRRKVPLGHPIYALLHMVGLHKCFQYTVHMYLMHVCSGICFPFLAARLDNLTSDGHAVERIRLAGHSESDLDCFASGAAVSSDHLAMSHYSQASLARLLTDFY